MQGGRRPVAISGYGITTCLGTGAAANWAALREGRSGLGPIRSFDPGDHPVRTGGDAPPAPPGLLRLFPRDLAPLAHLLGACREALAMAGLEGAGGTRAGLVIGSSLAHAGPSASFLRLRSAGAPPGEAFRALEGSYIEEQLARIAGELGFEGPALLVSNACAAGASCVARAAEMLRSERCDLVVAAGYDDLSPFTHAGFGCLFALSRTRPRPFGAGRDGMNLGAGFAAMVLEPLERVLARPGRAPRAILAGHGESSDAHHLTHPHPDGLGAALAMHRALEMAGIGPEEIDAINCHGTATPSNDSAEARALRSVFGERLARIPVCASKPALGHTLGAAGAVEAVVTILSIEHGFLPPTPDAGEIDPALGPLDLVSEGRPGRIGRAMSNSFGFGGCNASLILAAPGACRGGGK